MPAQQKQQEKEKQKTEAQAQAAEAEAQAAEAEAEATAEAEAHAEMQETNDIKIMFFWDIVMDLGVQEPPGGSFEKGTKKDFKK